MSFRSEMNQSPSHTHLLCMTYQYQVHSCGTERIGYGHSTGGPQSDTNDNCRGINISLTPAHGNGRHQKRSRTGIGSPSESEAQFAPLRGGGRSSSSPRPASSPGRGCARTAPVMCASVRDDEERARRGRGRARRGAARFLVSCVRIMQRQ